MSNTYMSERESKDAAKNEYDARGIREVNPLRLTQSKFSGSAKEDHHGKGKIGFYNRLVSLSEIIYYGPRIFNPSPLD